jgi:hypothetical protein
MKLSIQLALGLSLVNTAGSAQTNDDAVRQHVWAAIGPGYGSAAFSCGSCTYRRALGTESRRLGGSSITGGAGWAPNRHVRFGLVYDGWLNGVKKHDSLPTLDFFNLTAAYSPRGSPGPFVEAGWGVSRYALELGSGSLLDPVAASHDSFAAGWGKSYRLGLGWNGKGFAAQVVCALGRQRTLWAADSGAVASRWSEQVIFVVVQARAGGYGMSPRR